jgi:hypothetical protein
MSLVEKCQLKACAASFGTAQEKKFRLIARSVQAVVG